MDQRIERQLELLGVGKNEVDHLYSGADRWVVRYRDSFCLVVPNREEVTSRMETERRVLSSLRPCAGVRIPEPVWDGVPDGIFVYKFIPGRLLDLQLAETAIQQQADVNTDRISDFLATLHNTPCHDLAFLPRTNYFHGLRDVGKEQRIRDMLHAHDLLQAYDRAIRLWEEVEYSDSREVGLVHGDFGRHNLIVGQHDLCITGVIDFIDCFIGDVHFDFRWFYRWDKRVRDQLIQKYMSRSGRRLSEKTLCMYYLLDAFCCLFYAITYDRPADLAPGIQAVRDLLDREKHTEYGSG